MINEARVGAFTVAGQPTEKEFRDLKAAGYTTVVNVRMPEEPGQIDGPSIEAHGLDYVSVPYTGASLSTEHVWKVREAVDAAGGSVLIH